jgi:hypothetical protein
MLTQSEMKIALGNFVLRESPSTTFARSLRMELAQPKDGSSASQESTEGKTPSILDGLDLDTLPANVRAQLEAKDKEFNTIKTNVDKLTADKTKAEEAARNHQARADRHHQILKDHNLLDGGNAKSKVDAQQDQVIQELTAELITEGLDPKMAAVQARVLAKVVPKASAIASQNVLGQVAPLGNAVNGMAAENAMNRAMLPDNDPNGYLQMEGIKEEVQTQVNFLASQGTAIDVPTINNLRAMALGNYAQKHGIEKLTEMRTNNSSIQQPQTFGGSFGSGGFRATNTQQRREGPPQAVNHETQQAAQATLAKMLVGTKGAIK